MFRINKGVFWLKLGYGLFAMALYTVLPFLALEMANQGLSDEDISFLDFPSNRLCESYATTHKLHHMHAMN